MPSHTPRIEPKRKKEQLLDSSENLRLAIFHCKSDQRKEKLAKRFRLANTSLLKAKVHVLGEIAMHGRRSQA